MESQNSVPCKNDDPVILTNSGHPITRKNIDPDALKILYRLDRLGFIAYLCGGAVRDLMLGKQPKDFDIVTDARPGQIKKRFANVYHHRAGVSVWPTSISRKARSSRSRRSGGTSSPAKRPAADGPGGRSERLYGTPREDAFRRDITINALYYDSVTFSVIDYVGGLEDLARRRIRIIGDPEERSPRTPSASGGSSGTPHAWDSTSKSPPSGRSSRTAICSRHAPGARLYEELNKDLAYETRPVIEALRRYRLLGISSERPAKTTKPTPACSRSSIPLGHRKAGPAGGVPSFPGGDIRFVLLALDGTAVHR